MEFYKFFFIFYEGWGWGGSFEIYFVFYIELKLGKCGLKLDLGIFVMCGSIFFMVFL